MSIFKISYRYALAFYEEARDKSIVDKILEDMDLIADTLSKHHRLAKMLYDPSSASDKKFETLRELFSKYVHERTLFFIKFLASKKRVYFIEEIVEQIKYIHRREEGIINLKIRLSYGLGEEFGKRIVDKLVEVTNKKFKVEIKVDESLQGGFTYACQGKVFDYSIKGKLQDLAKRLNSA